jgi:hypothetical protein
MIVPSTEFPFFSVPEAAIELGMTEGRIRQLLLAGELKGHKLGIDEKNQWAIPCAEVKKAKGNRPTTGRPRISDR